MFTYRAAATTSHEARFGGCETMGLTTEQKAYLKHLKREVQITKKRVLETTHHLKREADAIHAHHLACERLRAYTETIND